MAYKKETSTIKLPEFNRAARRLVSKKMANKSLYEQTLEAYDLVARSEQEHTKYLSESGITTISELIYRGENMMPRIQAWHQYNAILNRLKPTDKKDQEFFNRLNIMAQSRGGVNLHEIEHLPLPVEAEGFTKIGQMYFQKKFLGLIPRMPNNNEKVTMSALPLLAGQPLAQKEIKIPKDLQPLADRAKEYFDFGLPYFTDPYRNAEEELAFLHFIVFSSFYTLPHLISYIPARLGILPQTAFEMYLTKSNIGSTNDVVWKTMNSHKSVEKSLSESYPVGTLNSDLVNPSDVKSGNRLSAKKVAELLENRQIDPIMADQMVDLYGGFRKKIRADILDSRQGVLVIPTDADENWAKISVTTHNNTASSSYRNTLIIALQPRGEEKPIIVELDQRTRLHGVPNELVNINPHAEMVLKTVVLDRIVKFCTDKYSTSSSSLESGFEPIRMQPIQPLFIHEEAFEPKVKNKTRGKSKTDSDITERPEEIIQKAAFVEYDINQIKVALGNKDVKIINRIVATLSRFETTGEGLYTLTSAKDRGVDDLYALRMGGYRIVISGKSGNFKVEDVLIRSEYENKGLERTIDRYIQSKK